MVISKKDLRILYLGTPILSAQVLEKLILNGYNIVGVVAQVDKEKDRKGRILEVPTKVIAKKYNIPLFQKEKLRLDYEFIKELEPDIILTLAYGQILPIEILNIPKYGSYNLHGSLLPKYRGAAPIQYALLNGDKVTGVTLMEMVKEMDAGKMYKKVSIPIEENDNYTTLSLKMVDACFEAFDEGILDVVNKINLGEVQDENEVTFTKKIAKEDEVIDFNKPASEVFNLIRALNENPGCYFIYNNEKYKVGSSILINNKDNSEPGTILENTKKGLLIKFKEDALLITKIQKPGKKMLNYPDFFNGYKGDFVIGNKIN